MKPGEVDFYDHSYVKEQAPKWQRFLHTYFRSKIVGIENCPNTPFLAVGNHSGGIMIPDTLVWLSAYHNSNRTPPLLTLAHDGFFDMYPQKIKIWASKFGAVRAQEENALEGLRKGYAVQVYPGGDFDACRPFSMRNKIEFAGRKGYVELAKKAKVPIVPIVSHGAHSSLLILRSGKRLAKMLGVDTSLRLKTFPISMSVPWGLWVGPLPGYIPLPTKITIEVCPPISFQGNIETIDRNVRTVMQSCLDRRCA